MAITTINKYDEMEGFNKEVLEAMHVGEQEQPQNINIEEIYETASQPFLEFSETETANEQPAESLATEETTEADNMEAAETVPQETTSVTAVPATIYIVKKGDTLQGICRSYYGSDQYVKAVCRENGIDDPDNIIQGQKIVLP